MIIRHKLRGHFAMIPNAIFHDTRLSIEAKALLAYLLSLPGNWEVRHDQLQRKLGIGRKLLDRCFREVIAAGYVARDEKQGRDQRNRFTTLNYIVRNVPELPTTEAPEPRRREPKRPRDNDSNNEDNKTDFNNPFSKSLPAEQAGGPKAQQVVYSQLGQRAPGRHTHGALVRDQARLDSELASAALPITVAHADPVDAAICGVAARSASPETWGNRTLSVLGGRFST